MKKKQPLIVQIEGDGSSAFKEAMLKAVAKQALELTSNDSVQCPYCKWGFAPSVIKQHIREKH